MKFIIDCDKWICGQPNNNDNQENCLGNGDTRLLNGEGYMDCVGQVQKHINVNRLTKWACYPEESYAGVRKLKVDNPLIEPAEKFGFKDSALTRRAIDINDDLETKVSKKRKLLSKLFKESGHELEFINIAPKHA